MIENFYIEEKKRRELFHLEFDRIAKEILNEHLLITPHNSYKIREIEFYYFSEHHHDHYCHQHERQISNSNFYFHRFKNPEKYINLKQKGIDITIGNTKESYGGILIRAIQNIQSNEVFTGIGLISNRIIEEIGGTDKIIDLYRLDSCVFDHNSSLRLEKSINKELKIFKKQRQGINLLPEDSDGYFLTAPYNYFSYPEIFEVI